MTFKEFLEELKGTRGWYLTEGQSIRRTTKCNRIVCPICHLANKRAKKVKYGTITFDAKEMIGLSSSTEFIIIMAADGLTDGRARRQLLKACGLSND